MPAMDETPRFCPACGYDLLGIDSEICPECGGDRQASDESPLPVGCAPAMTHLFVSLLGLVGLGFLFMPSQSVFPVGPILALVSFSLALVLLRAGRSPRGGG